MLLLLALLLLPAHLSSQNIWEEPSLLREKREQNSYGDENVTPEEAGAVGYEGQVEQTVAPVDNAYETDQPDIYPAGYRRKREEGGQNSYGDEVVTPKGLEPYQAVTEEPLQPVENQGYEEDQPPPSQAAGY